MRMTLSLLAPFTALALAASPVLAQNREPFQRQALVDLAYVLGEAHGLRQLCAGSNDQYWRARMLKMLEAESADSAFEQRLRETFNSGFVSRQSQFIRCSPESREEEARVAAHGRNVARRLTGGPSAR